jgi:1,4-dihydroxy-6-naphthoate synthase
VTVAVTKSLGPPFRHLLVRSGPMKIRLGHSPDSDDAFMFWGLAKGPVQTEHEFEHLLRDIQTLNEWAMEGKLESTAVSVHAFAYVADRYALLRHGGSFGDDYGPMIVAKRPISPQELRETTIAVPGKLTSAFLALNLYFAERFGEGAKPKFEVVPFDEIIPAVLEGRFEAGLIIHEGQLTYGKEGLTLIEDMGRWWKALTGLPLPLGVNVVRKDLGPEIVREVSRCMRESIQAGLDHREQALEYALQFARGMDPATSDEFVGMYVNERTLDMGEEGVRAIRLFLQKGAEAGIVPQVEVEVVD